MICLSLIIFHIFRALLKLIRKGDSLNLNHYLSDALSNFDLTGFVVPFVTTLFECLAEGLFIENRYMLVI